MYEEDDPQQPNTQINETLGREVAPAHPARPIIPLIPPTAQPAMESSSSSTSQPEIETREPAVVTILEPELGRGQRRRQPPVTLKNFITNSAQTRLLGSSSNGKELMYPITNYVSYGRFSACHTAYQVSTGKITPPKSYKKAVEDEWFKKAMGTEITAQPCVRKLQVSPPKIANSFTLLGDLKVGRCSTTTKQRLCKEGSVNANRLSICRERFTKGSVYKMSGFDVTQNFRLSDAPSPYVSLMALFLKSC
ncbi:hypothetical protein YC2023_071416 [Brassica napus]